MSFSPKIGSVRARSLARCGAAPRSPVHCSLLSPCAARGCRLARPGPAFLGWQGNVDGVCPAEVCHQPSPSFSHDHKARSLRLLFKQGPCGLHVKRSQEIPPLPASAPSPIPRHPQKPSALPGLIPWGALTSARADWSPLCPSSLGCEVNRGFVG